ncbi:site-specific integrase [Sinomonas cellulolyticus]|uniref:Tyr recombinase domain-containing protein n=1 Tax=Sinomonas cellulolyticus TaxID=2801916 RepID=A0ABS1K5I9_9MICC|nr:hypothetical protein [Sinomonas cellulolyticus]
MGVDQRVVMDIMGWSQTSMVQRYQHVVDELKTEAGARVGAALSRPTNRSPRAHRSSVSTTSDASERARVKVEGPGFHCSRAPRSSLTR